MPLMFSTVLFDLDDTLYPAASGLWLAIKERITLYMVERLGIPREEVVELRQRYYEQYGTALRGIEVNYPVDRDDYLAYVHNLPLRNYIGPNPVLRAALESLSTRKCIFTNADAAHARRVLDVLGVSDCFEIIIDVNALAPYCKPMPGALSIAMQAIGESDPHRVALIDDLPRTTKAAREFGLFTVLFGQEGPHPDADATLNDWNRLKDVLNGRV